MSQNSKPTYKEFWVWKDYDKKSLMFQAQAQETSHPDHCFHVIEISALTELQAKYDELKLKADGLRDMSEAFCKYSNTLVKGFKQNISTVPESFAAKDLEFWQNRMLSEIQAYDKEQE